MTMAMMTRVFHTNLILTTRMIWAAYTVIHTQPMDRLIYQRKSRHSNQQLQSRHTNQRLLAQPTYRRTIRVPCQQTHLCQYQLLRTLRPVCLRHTYRQYPQRMIQPISQRFDLRPKIRHGLLPIVLQPTYHQLLLRPSLLLNTLQ